ncbi:uncharacterized protein LOC111829045 [Capsella rubella]|uniref:uncharacterized protein LOC111829045 n=1 Tax=Capsella rubella TaxID=81985 RepID=UPI000CD55900|nr:uncharacterized protein LOC111829045 [Capsella rubella]
MENDQQTPYSRDEVKEEMKNRLEPVVIDPNQDLSDSCCGICSKTAYDFNEEDYDEGEGEGEYKDEGEGKGEGAVEDESVVEGEADQGEGEGEGEVENVEDEDAVEDVEGVGEGVSDGEVEYVEDEDDDHRFISTPFCSHKFCKSCWREYLEKNFYSLKENLTIISCPNQDCRAAVEKQTIEKLGVHDIEMYENYVMKSYLEIKQLHVPKYNYDTDHI